MDKEYLNEKSYKKVRKGILIIGITIIIVGMIGCSLLIKKGIENKKVLDEKWTQENIDKEINELEVEYTQLSNKQSKSITEEERLSKIKSELHSLVNTDIETQKKMDSDSDDYITLFIIAGFVAFASIMLGMAFLGIAYGRQIIAWKAQQVIPVAKEGIEEMGPSIGKVARDIKDSISKEDNK